MNKLSTVRTESDGPFRAGRCDDNGYQEVKIIGGGGAGSTVTAIDQSTPGTTDSITVKASGGIGSLTETSPATDTASSGLNGRLQRIAQNISTSISSALAAGSNIIGKVGIDQTTPGTTNAITQTTAALASSTTMQNAVSATGNGTSLNVSGFSIASLEVVGTFVATITFEASKNDTTWYSIDATYVGGNIISPTATAAGAYRISVGGFKSLRARVTWTSGTSVTITGAATLADAPPKVVNALLPYTIAGEDIANDVLKIEERKSFVNITTQTTTVVKSGAGALKRIVFGKPLAAGVVTLYDNTAASGTLISTITFPATLLNSVTTLDFDCAFSTGLTVVTSGATQDITVIYR